jgi:type IV pilus assembly protein PilV
MSVIKLSNQSVQKGFTLMEVLVAVSILSVGLLGIANLQMLGLTYNQNSYYRSQAVHLAYDITERMLLNQEGVKNGNYNDIDLSSTPSSADCESSACNSSQLAAYDLYLWGERIFGIDNNGNGNFNDSGDMLPALPNAPGIVTNATIVNDGNDLFTITLKWGEKEGAIESDKTFSDFAERKVEVYLKL